VGAGVEDLRVELARACRVMAHTGLSDGILGHVGHRLDGDRLLVRCRGPRERGLRFTVPDDFHVVDLDGGGGPGEGYRVPNELPIHTEVFRRRADVEVVVHVHPEPVVVAGLARVPLVPLFGAFDIPAMRLAEEGIAVHPRSVLLRDRALAGAMVDDLGDRPACVLVGHGLVTTGSTVAAAMLTALAVVRLCRVALAVIGAGGEATAIPDEDRAELPDLGAGFNEVTAWRHHLACLRADGWDLEEDR
jgi:ribulose-5-phosphate 4-epimerase/fuculose-1-phosphate aldolase